MDELKSTLGADVQVLMPDVDARIHAGEQVVSGKLTGSWPKLATVPDIRLAPGDRVGSLEVIPSPGHSPGHVSFLDTRDRSLIAGDVFTTIGTAAVSDHFYWRFPLAAMATYDKARDLESARALRALAPTLLAVGHGRAVAAPGDRDRRRDPTRRALMPRAGLDAASVVAAAARLADRDGLEQLTLARLAAELGVRAPSLYAHVDGLGDLRDRVGALGVVELTDALSAAATGRAGREALHAVAVAYRAYAHERPGVYAAMQRAPEGGDDERRGRAPRGWLGC